MAAWPSRPPAPAEQSRLPPRHRCQPLEIDKKNAAILRRLQEIRPVAMHGRRRQKAEQLASSSDVRQKAELPSSSDFRLISRCMDSEICSIRLSPMPPCKGRPSKARPRKGTPVQALPAIRHPIATAVQGLPLNTKTVVTQSIPSPKYMVAEKNTSVRKIVATAKLRAGDDFSFPTFGADFQVDEYIDAVPEFLEEMSFNSFSGRVVAALGEYQLPLPPPLGLAYSDVEPLVVGQSMSLAPKVVGKVDEFVVDPALPDGLTLHSATGVISGTPTGTVLRTPYRISAQNHAGVASTICDITVVAPPSHSTSALVIYPYPPVRTLTKGEHVELLPKIIGSVDEFTVDPKLPAGLSLDAATGLISGSPVAPSDMKTYMLTAKNAAGSTITRLTLGVRTPSFKGLSYLTLEPEDFSGVTFARQTQNQKAENRLAPMLPAEYFLDTKTGMIRWQPNWMDLISVQLPLAFSEDNEDNTRSDDDEMISDEEDEKNLEEEGDEGSDNEESDEG